MNERTNHDMISALQLLHFGASKIVAIYEADSKAASEINIADVIPMSADEWALQLNNRIEQLKALPDMKFEVVAHGRNEAPYEKTMYSSKENLIDALDNGEYAELFIDAIFDDEGINVTDKFKEHIHDLWHLD